MSKAVKLPDYRLTAEELAAYDLRINAAVDVGMGDPIWRLHHLYQIQDADGELDTFTPTDEQKLVIWCIFGRGWLRILIPKSRQLGMSTLLCLIELDGAMWVEGFKAAWIDKTLPDCEEKLREKILFAFDRSEFAGCFDVRKRDEKKSFAISLKMDPLAVGPVVPPIASNIRIGKTVRGGTVQMMVVSEWGWIQVYDRIRSREILKGCMPVVEKAKDGLCVIETTWEGGLDGEVGNFAKEALATPEESKGPKSWRILFFGWHTDKGNRQSHGYIDGESAKYFEDCEVLGLFLDHEQKLWYAEKRRTMDSVGTNVKSEYPTFVHECWHQLPKGSIYGPWLEKARADGRISNFLVDTRWPVDTFWDCGHPLNTVTWLIQTTPWEIRVVGVLMDLDITLEERKARLDATGFNFRYHCIPWETDEKNTHSKKPSDEYRRVLGSGVRVIDKIDNKWTGIGYIRGMFSRMAFHATNCEQGIDHLGRYWAKTESSTGTAVDTPVHDKFSHAADAFRQYGQAVENGVIPNAQTVIPANQNRAAPVVRRAAR